MARRRPAALGLLVPLALTGVGVAVAAHPHRHGHPRPAAAHRPDHPVRTHRAAVAVRRTPAAVAHRRRTLHVAASPARLSRVPREFTGLRTVGALFWGPVGSSPHTCTGSVVHSPGGDLVLTAAHCVAGNGTGMRFVPDYHDGAAPYGSWPVAQVYVTHGWLDRGDPRQDVAFLLVQPQTRDGRAVNLEDRVGAARLVTGLGRREVARVVGYPDKDQRPISCTNRTYDLDGYLGFHCAGYTDGTSGSPFLVDADGSGRLADVDGVIGGLHQGGCTTGTSYSAYFGPAVEALYRRALAGGPGDTVPLPPGAGCG